MLTSRTPTVINIDFGVSNPTYICTVCRDWQTKDLTDVAEHTVSHQYTVEYKAAVKVANSTLIKPFTVRYKRTEDAR